MAYSTVIERTQNTVTLADDQNPRQRVLASRLGALHYQSELDSGAYDTPVDFRPQRINTAALDGWRVTAADWHFALGQPAGKSTDGWFGFGGRQGQHWLMTRLVRLGYLRWADKSWTDVGGAPTYNRQNLSQSAINRPVAGLDWYVANEVNWANIWTAPGGGTVSAQWLIGGQGVKEYIRLNQAARDYIATQYPGGPTTDRYFSLAFQVDALNIPRWLLAGALQGDLTDIDNAESDTIIGQTALGQFLFSLPLDYAWVEDANGNPISEEIPLRKRLYWDGTQYILLVAARVDVLNGLPAGTLVFDPTIAATPSAGADDGMSRGTSQFDNTGLAMHIGERSLGAFHPSNLFARWAVSGLSGVTIDACTITLYGHSSTTGTPANNTMYFEDASTPAQIASVADYNSRTTTTASVAWNPSGVTVGSSHTSPSLVSVAQEIADSYDPSHIQLLYKNAGAGSTDNFNQFRTYENTGFEPELDITYTTGLDLVRVLAEAENLDSTNPHRLSLRRLLAEAVNLSEALARLMAMIRAQAETEQVSEAKAPILGRLKQVAEAVNIAETLARFEAKLQILAETVNVSAPGYALGAISTPLSAPGEWSTYLGVFEYYNVQTYGPNVLASLTLNTLTSSTDHFISVRLSGDPGSFYGYSAEYIHGSSTASLLIYSNTPGSGPDTILASDGAYSQLNVSDKFAFRATGTLFEILVDRGAGWVVALSVSDTTYAASAGYIGWYDAESNYDADIAVATIPTEASYRLLGGKLIAETINLIDTYLRNGFARIAETVNVQPYFSPQLGFARFSSDTVNISTDSVVFFATAFSRIVSETVYLLEEVLRRGLLVQAQAETVNISDALARFLGFVRLRAETVNISETTDEFAFLRQVVDELVQISHRLIRRAGFVRPLAEIVNIPEELDTHTLSRLIIDELVFLRETSQFALGLIQAIAETVNLVTAAERLTGLLRYRDETVRLGETRYIRLLLVLVLSESVTIVSDQVRAIAIRRLLDEFVHINHRHLRPAQLGRIIENQVTIDEDPLSWLALNRLINEVIDVTETRPYLTGLVRTATETVNVVEGLLNKLYLIAVISEYIEISEVVERSATLSRVQAEAVHLLDEVNRAISYLRHIAETVQIEPDDLVFQKTISRFANEAVQVIEALLAQAGLVRTLAEAVQIGEDAPHLLGFLRSVSEQINILDANARQRGLNRLLDEWVLLYTDSQRPISLRRLIADVVEIRSEILRDRSLYLVVDELVHIVESLADAVPVLYTLKDLSLTAVSVVSPQRSALVYLARKAASIINPKKGVDID